MRFVRWLFRTFAPFGIGIGVGIGFFILFNQLSSLPGIGKSSASVPKEMTGQAAKKPPAPTVTTPTSTAGVAPAVGSSLPSPVASTPPVQARTPAPAPTPVVPPPTAATARIDAPAPTVPGMVAIPPVEEPSGPAAQALATDLRSAPATLPAPVVNAPAPAAANAPAPAAANAPAPAAAHAPAANAQTDGGAPPSATVSAQPVPDNSPAAQWRRACQERLAWSKRMVEDGLNQCPKAGYMRQNCLDYYRGLERRHQGVTCDPKSGGGMPMAGW